jgi:hypothetical protein
MKLYDLLQLSVFVFSVLAAGFWLQSATIRPAKLATKAGSQGDGASRQVLTSQSRWNAAGAGCAGTAAFSQSVAVMLPYVGLN